MNYCDLSLELGSKARTKQRKMVDKSIPRHEGNERKCNLKGWECLKVRTLKKLEILRMKCEGLKHFESSDGRLKIVGSHCKSQNVFGRALKKLQK